MKRRRSSPLIYDEIERVSTFKNPSQSMVSPCTGKNVKRPDVPISDAASRTSSTMIREAKANDAEAWQRLVQLYSRRIYRWCRRAGLQPADAGNVVQEVLRSIARKLPDFQHGRPQDSFRAWIHRITQNKINDHFRHQGKQLVRPRGGTDAQYQLQHLAASDAHEPTWATTHDVSPGTTRIDLSELTKVRAEFSDRDWRIFWRVVVDGQSAVDVGDEFGITANAVRLVKMRLLRRLRQRLVPP